MSVLLGVSYVKKVLHTITWDDDGSGSCILSTIVASSSLAPSPGIFTFSTFFGFLCWWSLTSFLRKSIFVLT